jgi:hypothetical protein
MQLRVGVQILGIFCMGLIFSWARIGETREQIRERHGAGKEIGTDQIIFTILDTDVTITFRENRSIREIYTTRIGHNDEIRPMTLEIIKQLLEHQRPGVSWVKGEPEADGRILWVSSDQKLFAHYLPAFNSLTFELPNQKK